MVTGGHAITGVTGSHPSVNVVAARVAIAGPAVRSSAEKGIANEEWAYARDWTSDTQRSQAHQAFMTHYNQRRPHGALNSDTPMATLTRLSRDNVLGMHT